MGLSLTACAFQGSLDDLYSMLAQTRPVMAALQKEKISRVFARRIVTLIDSQWHQGNPLKDPKSIIAKEIGNERQELLKGYRYPEIDLDMSLILFPHKDTIVTLIQTDTPSWRSLITSLPNMTPFDYWDGEAPDTIAQDEWVYRKTVWEDLLAPDWVPANHGLIFTYRTPSFQADTASILMAAPTPAQRALTLAKDLHMQEWIKEHGIDSFSRGFFSMNEKPAASAIQEMADALVPTLPPLTEDLFNNGW